MFEGIIGTALYVILMVLVILVMACLYIGGLYRVNPFRLRKTDLPKADFNALISSVRSMYFSELNSETGTWDMGDICFAGDQMEIRAEKWRHIIRIDRYFVFNGIHQPRLNIFQAIRWADFYDDLRADYSRKQCERMARQAIEEVEQIRRFMQRRAS